MSLKVLMIVGIVFSAAFLLLRICGWNVRPEISHALKTNLPWMMPPIAFIFIFFAPSMLSFYMVVLLAGFVGFLLWSVSKFQSWKFRSDIASLMRWISFGAFLPIALALFATRLPQVQGVLMWNGFAPVLGSPAPGKPATPPFALWTYIAGPLASLAAGLIAGSAALWQFDQKQKADRAQFDRTQQQTRLTDALNRLSDAESHVRANAAQRLADLACQRDRHAPRALRDVPNAEQYPLFDTVASQFARTLALTNDADLRAEVQAAAKRLIAISEGIYPQPLLHTMIGYLADANRNAQTGFIHAAADYTSEVGLKKERFFARRRQPFAPR